MDENILNEKQNELELEENINETIEQTLENEKKVLDFIKNLSFTIISFLIKSEFPIIEIKSKTDLNILRRINFGNPKHTEQFALYIKLLSIIQNLIEQKQYATKRDIYYQFKHIFKTQTVLDNLIIDLARTLNVSRNTFHIISTPKGLVAGDLQLTTHNGYKLNFNHFPNGYLIPNFISMAREVKTNALFVLIVEKDATFQRLIDDNFLTKYPAVLITGKGEPDINTRQLAHLLYKKFKSQIKFFCLTDANPFGIQIMSVYKYGSNVMSYHSEELNVPTLKWIGLKLNDLDKFDIKYKNEILHSLNASDKRIALSLLKKFKNLQEYELIDQLELMLSTNSKAELQYLQFINNSFLCNSYLKAKLDLFLVMSRS